jgi:hypothetical protein
MRNGMAAAAIAVSLSHKTARGHTRPRKGLKRKSRKPAAGGLRNCSAKPGFFARSGGQKNAPKFFSGKFLIPHP